MSLDDKSSVLLKCYTTSTSCCSSPESEATLLTAPTSAPPTGTCPWSRRDYRERWHLERKLQVRIRFAFDTAMNLTKFSNNSCSQLGSRFSSLIVSIFTGLLHPVRLFGGPLILQQAHSTKTLPCPSLRSEHDQPRLFVGLQHRHRGGRHAAAHQAGGGDLSH